MCIRKLREPLCSGSARLKPALPPSNVIVLVARLISVREDVPRRVELVAERTVVGAVVGNEIREPNEAWDVRLAEAAASAVLAVARVWAEAVGSIWAGSQEWAWVAVGVRAGTEVAVEVQAGTGIGEPVWAPIEAQDGFPVEGWVGFEAAVRALFPTVAADGAAAVEWGWLA